MLLFFNKYYFKSYNFYHILKIFYIKNYILILLYFIYSYASISVLYFDDIVKGSFIISFAIFNYSVFTFFLALVFSVNFFLVEVSALLAIIYNIINI